MALGLVALVRIPRRRYAPPPDPSRASGFRLCSMLLCATVERMGVAIGRASIIAPELQQGTLVPLFERHSEAHTRCCLISTPAARRRPEVQAFREWILQQAANERPADTALAG